MKPFDGFMAVDWSASNRPTVGKDSIWVAHRSCQDKGEVITSENISTRTKALDYISAIWTDCLANGQRVFAGFDFAFGYPAGFAKALTGSPDWHSVWSYLGEAVINDADNQSNRFEVAAKINAALGDPLFWGKPHQHRERYPDLPMGKPSAQGIPQKRLIETLVPTAKSVFQLAYNGAVGSQTLLGIAALQEMRQRFGDAVHVWPFDTQFTDDMPPGPCIIVGEIYPSLLVSRATADDIKDRLQVEAVVEALTHAAPDDLKRLFEPPTGVSSEELNVMLTEEGAILGAELWGDLNADH